MSQLDDNSGRLIAIGDIHGHRLALEKLLELIQPRTEDRVVTLGDYINRGPESRGVLEILLTLGRHCRHFPILGNHEEMIIDSRHNLTAESRWMDCGGDDISCYPGPKGRHNPSRWRK
ncbi:MAG: metallophosphoesterase, partial [Pirellulaceae bacterium]